MFRVGGIIAPQRKRVRTTRVLQMEQQNGDMEWQEEGETSGGALEQNRARKQTAPKSELEATPEPVFCTMDTSRVPQDHIGDATPTMIRKTVEQEMRNSSD
ncbi:Uncharacterized protein HZ326_27540 [Fusarium oxysporum f. sp. albedinis]|nr:Uncharacterized protein HZ326_27540 [Fusarium oxysporum f. sp. albedinis]